MAREVTTLKHEVGDDTVEGGALVAEAVLAGGELSEVAGGLGDDVIKEPEDDTAGGLVVDRDVELRTPTPPSEYKQTRREQRAGGSKRRRRERRQRTRVGCKNG